MPLMLYNTLTRRKEVFEPLDPARVTMYVCGPTVYNYAHIGNARPPVVFDVLFRLLRHLYPEREIVYARNITDIDDKIMAAAEAAGVPIEEITDRYTRAYQEDTGDLNVSVPSLQPCATEHVAEMITMTETLIDAGHAYAADGHVLFDVTSYADYGRLSGRTLDDMIAGARVEVASYKRHPGDFVLWKPSTADQPGWDSPWGRGRPGWHLECSVMAEKHLGETIDIHGGGTDLVFPHHENEIAQSVCAHGGRTFARYWLHNGFLTIDAEKMSKSLGNVLTIHELRQRYPGEVLRMALLSAHYRQPIDWSEETVAQAQSALDRMYRCRHELRDIDSGAAEPPRALIDALSDDLNTPMALSVVHDLVSRVNRGGNPQELAKIKAQLTACGELLGILQADPEAWLQGRVGAAAGDLDTAAIEALVARRADAKAARDYAAADRIRDELAAGGVVLEDGAEGTRWRIER